jgi:integrase
VQARNVERAIARLARQAGLPRPVSPHDLRHTYGTLLIEAGVSPVYVQRQLGHASIQLTVGHLRCHGAPAAPGERGGPPRCTASGSRCHHRSSGSVCAF